MDGRQFDHLARVFAQTRSRRGVLRGAAAAAAGALGLARLAGPADAARDGNSDCAKFCAAVFGADTAAADQCTSQAAHGTGMCYQCGPAAPASNGQQLCGTHCIPVCPPPADACHGQGACNPSTGACSPNPLLAGFCFVGGACFAQGAINPTNQCQICDPSQTTTAFSNRPNGAACDDGNACTQTDTCQNGVCVGSNPVVCAPADQCHQPGVCNPAAGTCSYADLPDQTPCNTANKCRTGDVCTAGVCGSGANVVCDSKNGCVVDSCDPAVGCVHTNKPLGAACDDGNACTQTDACDGQGTCVGGNLVICHPSDQCHGLGTCDPNTGTCSNPTLADGTPCNDGNACTQTDTCQAGVCTGGNPVVCTALDQCHQPGTCDPASGVCSNPDKGDGTSCNDGNACTQTDACQSGICTGANPVVCAPLDACHVAGTCDPAKGVCSNPAGNDGAPCGTPNCVNGELTTYGCAGGACAPTTAPCPGDLICATSGSACLASCATDNDCVSGYYCASGTCQPKQANGSSCGTGSQCFSGNCVGGFCCATASCGPCEYCNSGSCASGCVAGEICAYNQYCCMPEPAATFCPGVAGARSAYCGLITDFCGLQVDCGACTSPNTCGGGGSPNLCGCSSCSYGQVCLDLDQYPYQRCCFSGPGNYFCDPSISPNPSCCSGVCVETTSYDGVTIGQCT